MYVINLDDKNSKGTYWVSLFINKNAAVYFGSFGIEYILVSTVTGCVSISAFAWLVCVPVDITSSAVRIKICAITAGIKKCKSIINKKRKKHDKIVLLGKDKLNTIEVLISKVLNDSYISRDEFLSVNNVLREYYEMKKETPNPETSVEYTM